MSRPRVHIVRGVLSLSLLLFAGCASVRSDKPVMITDAVRQRIYERTAKELNRVILFKPEANATSASEIYLAPLLLQQVQPNEANTCGIEKVWFFRGTVSIHGRIREQRSYYWRVMDGANRRMQGVRITLDGTGAPVCWEIFRDSSGAEIIWVSQNLEIDAADQFGAALPGRLCSVERSMFEAPRLVVPNVVDEGPMPMGPVVYLSEAGDIPIVACRCSAAQAEMLEVQHVYQIEEIDVSELEKKLSSDIRSRKELENWFDPERLMKRLRLPGEL